ncbi:NADH-quinone oxidoreductase, subunit M [Nitrospina gracilis 3/211]|uniref:NADH-quinone oxidoreductase, subunit M n=1 Tax=Nitrospina gracilis (strain 3/211) TaxID=1266370 RepID=M1YNR4_NITG3|nr:MULTISPECIES: NADH-quinone oxidoreductase subunit M [Nitrospina]MCF8722039.1 NADH-quinone oxidoreductase subunit M [Nitrospina sp. Nb-3]CCQ92166.1 NADH-quinone oxidoreductase, subunit M [Nitrospina gracilis 3/211]
MLTTVLLLPLAAAVLILFMDGQRVAAIQKTATIAVLLTFLGTLVLLFGYDASDPGMQYVNSFHWVPLLHIQFMVGVDGISLWMVVLTAFLSIMAVRFSAGETKNPKYYLALILILETGMLGVFVALDLILFYVFWEVMLIPTYFLIGLWGEGRRVYATTKFVIFTLVGSLLMLVGMIWITVLHYTATHELTFNIQELVHTAVPHDLEWILFLFFFLAFAIKVPIFPFHSWLPHAYVSCPIPVLILVTGAMSKTGAYGLIRFCLPLFPDFIQEWGTWIGAAAVGGIIYGAWIAIAQKDLKSLVAYSSISHLGFVVLGIFAVNGNGVEGSVLQMVNHGIIASALFIIVGIIERRLGTRNLDEFSGLKKSMPILYGMFMLVTLAALGMPGLNGFVGEFLILVGVWTSAVQKDMAVLFVLGAGLTIVYASIYMLFMFQGSMQDKVKNLPQGLKDVNETEAGLLVPACILILFIGLYPKPFINTMSASVDKLLQIEKTVHVPSQGGGGGH